MRIINTNYYNQQYQTTNTSRISFPNLAPLKRDTVSFGAMKKNQFEGFDLVVVEKFKAPIEKFNTKKDLDIWLKDRTKKIKTKKYNARQQEATIQRKAMLKEWVDYLSKEKKVYTPAMQLLILNAITRELKENNDAIPPVLNKGVLADTMSDIKDSLKRNPKAKFDFNNIYNTKLRNLYLEDMDTGETETKWIVIPSKTNDHENFEANVDKLKVLSHKNWCTKSFSAEPYLEDGDMHIYLEKGQPKMAMRFCKDEIFEIQCERNDNSITLDYLDRAKQYIEDNNFKLDWLAKDEIKKATVKKENLEKIKRELKEAIVTNDTEKIYEYFGFEPKKDKNGFLTLKHYDAPRDITFKDLGLDETKLFEKVIKIEENLLINVDSDIKSLSNLEYVGNHAIFMFSKDIDLGNLQYIGGKASFLESKITSLGKLKYIGDYADFRGSEITDLGALEYVGNGVYLGNCYLEPEDFENVKVERK